MYWPHTHTVQRSNMSKGIPAKIACGTVRSISGASPHDFVGEGRGSGAPLMGQNAPCFLFNTKAMGLYMTHTILPTW
eukprot:12378984-Ditylum_brightwellii.AAC.1